MNKVAEASSFLSGVNRLLEQVYIISYGKIIAKKKKWIEWSSKKSGFSWNQIKTDI